MQNTRFVQFSTLDGLKLPGLLHEASRTKQLAIFLHGNGSSSVFYKSERWDQVLAPFIEKGVSILQFNNRGAYHIKNLNRTLPDGTIERRLYGCAYELIEECIYDIDAAIEFGITEGYDTFYLVGFSTGANKICVYHAYAPDPSRISKNILLAGGDDRGIYAHIYGEDQLATWLTLAKQKIADGKGEMIMSEIIEQDIFSYQSWADITDPEGKYNTFPYSSVLNGFPVLKKEMFGEFASIKTPLHVIYGDVDEYAIGAVQGMVEILKRYQPDATYSIIPGANHGFDGHEEYLGQLCATWLIEH
jgi:pimeloyl-ACP methyl ester carboxylesterase